MDIDLGSQLQEETAEKSDFGILTSGQAVTKAEDVSSQ